MDLKRLIENIKNRESEDKRILIYGGETIIAEKYKNNKIGCILYRPWEECPLISFVEDIDGRPLTSLNQGVNQAKIFIDCLDRMEIKKSENKAHESIN